MEVKIMEIKLMSIDSIKSQIEGQKAKITTKQQELLGEVEGVESQYKYLKDAMAKVEAEINEYREKVANQNTVEDSKKRAGFMSKFFSSDDQAKLLKLYERKQLIEFEMKEIQRLRTTGYTDKAKAGLEALIDLSVEEDAKHKQFTEEALNDVAKAIRELEEYQQQLRALCHRPFVEEERQTVALASEIALDCPEKVFKDIHFFGGVQRLKEYM